MHPSAAPVLTVMDGFGRELSDQYYKAGSSLEVMCTVDRLPARMLPEVIEWRHGDHKLSAAEQPSGYRYDEATTIKVKVHYEDQDKQLPTNKKECFGKGKQEGS